MRGYILRNGCACLFSACIEQAERDGGRCCAGIEDNIIGLLTGHKSRELRRYQHLREELKRKTVDLIAGVLKEAGKNGKGASSSRLLHAAPQKPKSDR